VESRTRPAWEAAASRDLISDAFDWTGMMGKSCGEVDNPPF
jgi:hypothetical protein